MRERELHLPMLEFNPPKAAVAQLDRVLGYEPRGRGFDSCQPRQKLKSLEKSRLFSFLTQQILQGSGHHFGRAAQIFQI